MLLLNVRSASLFLVIPAIEKRNLLLVKKLQKLLYEVDSFLILFYLFFLFDTRLLLKG